MESRRIDPVQETFSVLDVGIEQHARSAYLTGNLRQLGRRNSFGPLRVGISCGSEMDIMGDGSGQPRSSVDQHPNSRG
jgi:hypothetical protein